MNSRSEPKKHGKFHSFKSLFEIKRPAKPPASNGDSAVTLPRMKSKNDEDELLSRRRLFARNTTHRRTANRSKYKRDNQRKFNSESHVHEIINRFENGETSPPCVDQTNPNLGDAVNDIVKKALEKRDEELAILKNLHKNTEIKKRNFNAVERKIRSFIEAENKQETEEYRKSVINEMDLELAQMKADGFLDEEGNALTEIDAEESLLSNYLSTMKNNSIVDKEDDDVFFTNGEHKNNSGKKHNASESAAALEEQKYGAIEQDTLVTDEDMAILNSKFQDAFSDSLDIENGLHYVEAYNREDEELVDVQVMIDRRTVSLSDKQTIKTILKESEMILHQKEDESFDVIQDEQTSGRSSQEITPNNPTSSKQDLHADADKSSQESIVQFENPFNRSTFYSTTSHESSQQDEDDEGIDVYRNKEEVYSSVRRETFCDDNGVIRIERVACYPTISSPISRNNSAASTKTLEYIVAELKSTERKYVDDLEKVIKVFKPYIDIHTPQMLKIHQGYLFGNIEKIYRRQRKFQERLDKSYDVDEIANCFVDNQLLFEMYPSYFKNKPKADALLKEFNNIIKEMQENLQERLDFSAYLLTPVQRLGKYILFLENIQKQLDKLDLSTYNVQAALFIVKEEMSKGNDSVAIESIENSPISKKEYGSFVIREKFNVIKPKRVDSTMVFLFTNVVVFTTTDTRNLENFHYYDKIKMEDLSVATFDDYTIHLTDYTKSKKKQNPNRYSRNTYVLESKNEKIWKTWKEEIEKILWDQLVKAKESSVHSPKKYKENRSRIKSTGEKQSRIHLTVTSSFPHINSTCSFDHYSARFIFMFHVFFQSILPIWKSSHFHQSPS
ncbi:unnamed protein product [Phyllotreta striolata]|uniref:DH domain-containing protein n=1 Tax=Phyllotreta striolata TaxID=444603 RepID=A0A9P0DLQ2_PHYSR|nr:unnamed protein product [Phyllotreta striolata]